MRQFLIHASLPIVFLPVSPQPATTPRLESVSGRFISSGVRGIHIGRTFG